jgi:hypothetical protein
MNRATFIPAKSPLSMSVRSCVIAGARLVRICFTYAAAGSAGRTGCPSPSGSLVPSAARASGAASRTAAGSNSSTRRLSAPAVGAELQARMASAGQVAAQRARASGTHGKLTNATRISPAVRKCILRASAATASRDGERAGDALSWRTTSAFVGPGGPSRDSPGALPQRTQGLLAPRHARAASANSCSEEHSRGCSAHVMSSNDLAAAQARAREDALVTQALLADAARASAAAQGPSKHATDSLAARR